MIKEPSSPGVSTTPLFVASCPGCPQFPVSHASALTLRLLDEVKRLPFGKKIKRRLAGSVRPKFGACCMASLSIPCTARAQTRVKSCRRNAGQLLSANHTPAGLRISGASFGAHRGLRHASELSATSRGIMLLFTENHGIKIIPFVCILSNSPNKLLSEWLLLQEFQTARSPQSASTQPTKSQKSMRTSMEVSQSKQTSFPKILSERQRCAQSRILTRV